MRASLEQEITCVEGKRPNGVAADVGVRDQAGGGEGRRRRLMRGKYLRFIVFNALVSIKDSNASIIFSSRRRNEKKK